jgi:2-keto-4-pentenoate hydratase/2-oxohepta-3-ene-1,7-dioic acid hydratase in catechol pathway
MERFVFRRAGKPARRWSVRLLRVGPRGSERPALLDGSGRHIDVSSTENMVVGVAALVRYMSQFLVLYPGDLIVSGTPAGAALGQPDSKPYLRAGDVVELKIDGLGRARRRLVAA